MIRGFHHVAYRCRDSEETRRFYEDVLGLELAAALEVEAPTLEHMAGRGHAAGIETRGPADHGSIRSVYLRDPNGYVVELAARTACHAAALDPRRNGARATLDRWQAEGCERRLRKRQRSRATGSSQAATTSFR